MHIEICTEAGRWTLGIASVIAMVFLAIAMWTVSILLEARRRVVERIVTKVVEQHPPPPSWHPRRGFSARGVVHVGPGDEPIRLAPDENPPETPRSATLAPRGPSP